MSVSLESNAKPYIKIQILSSAPHRRVHGDQVSLNNSF